MTLPLTLVRTGRTDTQEGQTRNLSSCGVYFVVPEKLDLGSLLEFVVAFPNEISLTGGVRLVCKGKVTRVEQKEESLVGVAATIERYEFVRDAAN